MFFMIKVKKFMMVDIFNKFGEDKEKFMVFEDVFKFCRYFDLLSMFFLVVDIGVI